MVPALFLLLVVAMTMLVIGSVFSEPIVAAIRLRVPSFRYEAWMVMLIGLLLVMAFSIGLVVMYLALTP